MILPLKYIVGGMLEREWQKGGSVSLIDLENVVKAEWNSL